jgi:hypothetical protein
MNSISSLSLRTATPQLSTRPPPAEHNPEEPSSTAPATPYARQSETGRSHDHANALHAAPSSQAAQEDVHAERDQQLRMRKHLSRTEDVRNDSKADQKPRERFKLAPSDNSVVLADASGAPIKKLASNKMINSNPRVEQMLRRTAKLAAKRHNMVAGDGHSPASDKIDEVKKPLDAVETTNWEGLRTMVSPVGSLEAAKEDATSEETARPRVRRMILTNTLKYKPNVHRELRHESRLAARSGRTIMEDGGREVSGGYDEAKKLPSGVQDASQETIKQELQKLFEQVKMLKDALKEKTAAAKPSLKPGGNVVSLGRQEAEHEVSTAQGQAAQQVQLSSQTELFHQAGVVQRASVSPEHRARASKQQAQRSANSQPTFPTARNTARTKNSPQDVLDLGNSCFLTSTSELIHAAHVLQRCKPSIGKPLIAMVERRLAVIAQDARRELNGPLERRIKSYSGWDSSFQMAPTVVNLLERFNKEYRRSASVLASIVTSLEDTGILSAAHVTARIRDRLAKMFEEAKAEKNLKLCQTLLSHRRIWARTSAMLTAKALDGTHDQRDTVATKISPLGGTYSAKTPLVRRVELATNKDKRTAPSERSTPARPISAPFVTTAIPVSVYGIAQNEAIEAAPVESTPDRTQSANSQASTGRTDAPALFKENDKQRMARQIHTRSSALKSSDTLWETTKASDLELEDGSKTLSDNIDDRPSDKVLASSDEVSDQSLLEELFPEANVAPPVRQAEKPELYPKLDPPKPTNTISRNLVDRRKTLKEQAMESLQKRGEQITVLQLEHCSTELTESDFRRLIPKGEHIETWNRLGAYYKVIPGRDPLSLERLPFYYLLFKSPESAYAYQKNAGRLHKLAALHQPSSIFSAIPAPKGFLEDGEDINAVTTSYLLRPTEYAFTLRTLMQPYHPALRTLFEQGGYKPIVPEIDDKRGRISKVLMHIEGYEPSISDLFKTLRQDAFNRGTPFTLRNESSSSVHRLRDLINLKTRTLPISTSNPRAWESENTKLEFDDPSIAYFMKSEAPVEEENAKEMNQIVMNRVYNRWILDFSNEDEARRFAISWHRRVLPDFIKGERTWKDYEEVRMCNTELLW